MAKKAEALTIDFGPSDKPKQPPKKAPSKAARAPGDRSGLKIAALAPPKFKKPKPKPADPPADGAGT